VYIEPIRLSQDVTESLLSLIGCPTATGPNRAFLFYTTMAKLRSVSTNFWSDTYISELDPIEKLLFLYLITNDANNMIGIYEIALKRIAFDTGIDKEMVEKILNRFIDAGKIQYIENHVILNNFTKNNKYNANMWVGACELLKRLPESLIAQIDVISIFLNMGSTPAGKEELFEEMKALLKGSKGFERVSNGLQRVRKSNLIQSNLIKGEENQKIQKPLPLSSLPIEQRTTRINQLLSESKLSESQKELYLLKIESNGYQKKQGGSMTDITEANLKADAEFNLKQGWLNATNQNNGVSSAPGGYWNE
jgi:hypothetical protein